MSPALAGGFFTTSVTWEAHSYIYMCVYIYAIYSTIFFSSPLLGFPGSASGKESTCQCRRHKRCRFDPWVGKVPWRKAWQPTPGYLPRESHRQRSLAGYSPWSHKESDMTEQLSTHMFISMEFFAFPSFRMMRYGRVREN